MSSFFAMLVANTKMMLRNRQALFWNLVFPAIFIVLFGAIFSNDNFSTIEVGIVNSDSPLSAPVVHALNESGLFKVHEGSEAEEISALENEDRSLVLSFPINEGDPLRIYAGNNPADTSSQVAMSATRSVLMDVMGAGLGVNIEEIRVDSLNTTFIDWFMPGIIAMSLMNTGIIGLSTAFVTFREKGILRRIKVTPLPLWQFLSARVLSSMLVGLASTFVLIGLSMLLYDAKVHGNWLLIIAMTILVSITMLSLGAAVAAVSRNVETAAGLANLITFPMMFLSGVFFPVESMPTWMRPIMTVMPLSYGVEVLRQPMLYGHGLGSIWQAILILVAITVVALGVSVRFFQWDSVKK